MMFRRIACRCSATLLLVALSLPAGVLGQAKAIQKSGGNEPAPKPKPQVIKLTVSPAPSPRAALRIRLLPKYLDRKPGNRASLYRRAMLHSNQVSKETQKKFYDGWEKWNKLPPSQLPRDEVRKGLGMYQSVLNEVEEGAWRERCDWDLRVREMRGTNVISLLLPDLQELRHFARVLSLRARLEIAEGQLSDAERTFQTLFQLSRDSGKQPFLVSALVGMAISSITTAELRHYIEHPNSPNLYWSITALPRPLVGLRLAAEQEQVFPLQMFPLLRDAEKKRTPEQWRAELLKMVVALGALDGGPRTSEVKAELLLTAMMLKGYPLAKRRLIAQGRDRREVEAMPVAQVVALHLRDTYDHAWGEMFKCFYLPYPQGLALMRRVEKQLEAEGVLAAGQENTEIIRFSSLLLPAVTACLFAEGRTERHLDELRVIEALRMFAAERGRWPKSLKEITQVPVPDDPVTGKPFVYRLDGATAVLESVIPKGAPPDGRRFELTLRKK